MTVLALYVLVRSWLELGLDFTGGTTIEVGFQQSVSLDKMHEALDQQKIDGRPCSSSAPAVMCWCAWPRKRARQGRAAGQRGPGGRQAGRRERCAQACRVRRSSVGDELATDGALAMLASIICILIYVAVRFEWRLATGASSPGSRRDHHPRHLRLLPVRVRPDRAGGADDAGGVLPNDTIVVFDRVRENFQGTPGDTAEIMDLHDRDPEPDHHHLGLTFVVVVALLLKGGPLIHGFSIAMVIGVAFGTYSSIYVASASAMFLGIKREHMLPTQVEKEGADQQEILP